MVIVARSGAAILISQASRSPRALKASPALGDSYSLNMTDSRWIDPILLPPEAFKLHFILFSRMDVPVFTQG